MSKAIRRPHLGEHADGRTALGRMKNRPPSQWLRHNTQIVEMYILMYNSGMSELHQPEPPANAPSDAADTRSELGPVGPNLPSFKSRLEAFRLRHPDFYIEDDFFESARDRSPGREINLEGDNP